VSDLDKSFFNKKNKEFSFHIQTDGISCSVLFHKKVPKNENIKHIKDTYDSIKKAYINSAKNNFEKYKHLDFKNKENIKILTNIKKILLSELNGKKFVDDRNNFINDLLINIQKIDLKNYLIDINKKYLKKMIGDVTKFMNTTIKNYKNGIFENYVKVEITKNPSKRKTTKVKLSAEEKMDRYIEDQNVAAILENKNYVVIDPNKTNLMYCLFHNNQKEPNNKPKNNDDIKKRTLVYSQGQRKRESGQNNISFKINSMRKDSKYNVEYECPKNGTISKISIEEAESKLSKYTGKTSFYGAFEKYLKMKNKINDLLIDFYENPIFRKFKWHIKIRTDSSESKFLNNFREKFGNNEETIE